MDIVDQEFRISYVLLLNSVTVKNMKFQVNFNKKEYVTRKLIEDCSYRSYLSNYMYIF